jgi:hypothetical protein
MNSFVSAVIYIPKEVVHNLELKWRTPEGRNKYKMNQRKHEENEISEHVARLGQSKK